MSKKLDQKDVVPYGHKYSDSDEEDDDNKQQTWKYKKAQLGAARVDLLDTINIIDTYDRPASAFAQKTYAQSGTYSSGLEDEPGIPKIGAYAEAGVGRAEVKFSVFEAEAKGPNASAGAEARVFGAGAMARAEVASASAKAGPVGMKVGLGFDTGASFDLWPPHVEAKVLGTGISIGPKTSVSVLGSEASCSFM